MENLPKSHGSSVSSDETFYTVDLYLWTTGSARLLRILKTCLKFHAEGDCQSFDYRFRTAETIGPAVVRN